MIELSDSQIKALLKILKEAGEDAITWNHYELAQKTAQTDPEVWKAFLTNQDVANWLDSELGIIQDSELKKMVKGAAGSRSVGQAQLMGALQKMNVDANKKEGPTFIYMHVPLNDQQQHADNASTLANNPFIKKEGDIE